MRDRVDELRRSVRAVLVAQEALDSMQRRFMGVHGDNLVSEAGHAPPGLRKQYRITVALMVPGISIRSVPSSASLTLAFIS